jgi:UDP-glucose 4-epimerase
MKKCLILGGGGFLGSHLAECLLEKGYFVRIFENQKCDLNNIKGIISDIELVKGDFLNETDTTRALAGIDYLFHFISTTVPATASTNPIYDIQTNLVGSIRLFQLAIQANIEKIIFPSSGGTIYGEPEIIPVKENSSLNPKDPYGISKLAIEKYLNYFYEAYGLDYLILRYSNPYGKRQNPYGKQGIIPIFLNKIKSGESPEIYGDGTMERDYIYIDDAIKATARVLENKTKEKVFNIGSGMGISVNSLLGIMSEITGKNIQPSYTKDTVVRVKKIILDISLIKEKVGWEPTTNIKDGIRRTWDWFISQSG